MNVYLDQDYHYADNPSLIFSCCECDRELKLLAYLVLDSVSERRRLAERRIRKDRISFSLLTTPTETLPELSLAVGAEGNHTDLLTPLTSTVTTTVG